MPRETVHLLKTVDRYWEAVAAGEKTFEIRRNDRAFQTGDILELVKTDDKGYWIYAHGKRGEGQKIRKRISYLLQGGQFGIDAGYCVLGLADPDADTHTGKGD